MRWSAALFILAAILSLGWLTNFPQDRLDQKFALAFALLGWLGCTLFLVEYAAILGLRKAEDDFQFLQLTHQTASDLAGYQKACIRIDQTDKNLRRNEFLGWVLFLLASAGSLLLWDSQSISDSRLLLSSAFDWRELGRLAASVPVAAYLIGLPLAVRQRRKAYADHLTKSHGNILVQAEKVAVAVREKEKQDYQEMIERHDRELQAAREAAIAEKEAQRLRRIDQQREVDAAGDAAREALRQKQVKWLQETGANLKQTMRVGTEGVGRIMENGFNASAVQPPLSVTVDPTTGFLFVGSLHFRIDDVIDATVIQTRPDGMNAEIASVVGLSALGPLGYVLGRAAGKAGVLDKRRLGLRLVVNDDREPIRFIEITSDPLPITSEAFRTAKAAIEKAVAQLQVLRLRRSGEISNGTPNA